MRLFTVVFIAFVILIAGTASVLGSELTGRVTNSGGNPLPAVSVVTDMPGVGTTTDESGRYTLVLKDEISRVTFSSVGYHPQQFGVDDVPEIVALEERYYPGGEIVVRGDRAKPGVSPMAFDNISREEIERDYTVGEFPLLLQSTPNVHAYTDGGGALGYSYISVRGFTDKRVATYINGVPLNDPEDNATYFVDLPDFAANITDIQIQRGVGNSLYGDASFGASINVVTTGFDRERRVALTSGYGEYTSDGKSVGDIYKQSLEYSSGLIDGRWMFGGRFSKQKTGGYRVGSWYRGWSYYFSVARLDPRMTTELHVYGGPMVTHLAYYGVGRETLQQNWRANPGIDGYESLTYDNATDNFNQPHYQLHNTYRLSDRATLSNTLYYIRGKGYYEQYKPDQDYAEYGIASILPLEGDLVRQKWVYKSQWGWSPRLDYEHERGTHTLGGSFYLFESEHWGNVVWFEHFGPKGDHSYRYYHHLGQKQVASIYGQEFLQLTDRLSAQATAQVRYERYALDQERMGMFPGYDFAVDWLFFSPRLGFNYELSEGANLYASAAVSSRTPTDNDIYDADKAGEFPSLERIDSVGIYAGDILYEASGDPTAIPERLYDFELGASYRTERYSASANLFYMDFSNEILEYAGSKEGRDVTINVNGSFHSGVELSGAVQLTEELFAGGNLALNYNRIKDYPVVYNYEVDSTLVVDSLIVIVSIDEAVRVNFKNKKLPNFPDYLGNLVFDYRRDFVRLIYYGRLIGRQYADLWNTE
ncbi:MAG: hypothetical protein DRP45_08755, partial [Candidatus Zixiibacteriota bacterium]